MFFPCAFNTIIMIGTSMNHLFRTLLLYGYSKTMQKSTNVFAYSTNLSARLRCHAAAGRAPILKLCSLITFWGRVAGEVRLMREARFNRHFILVTRLIHFIASSYYSERMLLFVMEGN